MHLIPNINTFYEYFAMGGFVMIPLILVAVLLWYALAYRALSVSGVHKSPRQLIKKAGKPKKREALAKERSILGKAACFALDTVQSSVSRRQAKSLINVHFNTIRAELSRHKLLTRSLVAAAPLLGLLGTVDGMIETFDSLGDMALFSATGGIAGGISKALFTTQVGLAISIPGLLFGRIIERRERNLGRELDQIRDLVCADK